MGPWLRSKMGRTASKPRKPLFLQYFGVLRWNELLQQVLEITGVVFGAHCENEPLENTFGVSKVILRFQGSSGCEARICRGSITKGRLSLIFLLQSRNAN